MHFVETLISASLSFYQILSIVSLSILHYMLHVLFHMEGISRESQDNFMI